MTTHATSSPTARARSAASAVDREEGDHATIINVPLFHVTGCNSQLIVMLELGGRTYVLANPLDLEGFLRTATEERVDMLTSVPAIYHALTRHPAFAEADLSSVSLVSYGGAPIAADSVRAIMAAFPRRGSAMASASPRRHRCPRSCRTRRRPSTPTRSASRCRSPTSRSTIRTPRPVSASCSSAVRTSSPATGTRPRRRPKPSSTGGCTRAISAGSTKTASSTSSTARRT